MNRQRKVMITITYNEMGIIIDTKAEEVAQPDLHTTCTQLAPDCISRQEAIDALQKEIDKGIPPFDDVIGSVRCGVRLARNIIEELPSAQPDLQPTCNQLAPNLHPTCTSDLISRQDAIDALEKVAELFPWKVPGNRDSYDNYNEAWNDAIGRAEIEIEKLPSAQPKTIQNNAVHLCDSCQYTYVTCPSHGNDAVFGDGKGNDNICACNKYRPISAQPDIAEKLYQSKCYITDAKGLQHEVIHTGDIRRVTGWEI